jgi:hypothetical protein
MLDSQHLSRAARQRSLAKALRDATGAARLPAQLVANFLADARAIVDADTIGQITSMTSPLAAAARHSLLCDHGRAVRHARWDLDF